MLSGRSTVVAADRDDEKDEILASCRSRLGLADDGTTMELWHGSELVLDEQFEYDEYDEYDEYVNRWPIKCWPGIKPLGEISEYQLLIK
eukprot:5387302-Amphidinium_carterae.1